MAKMRVHYGDTYGVEVWTACGKELYRVDARCFITGVTGYVTCKRCKYIINKGLNKNVSCD